MTAIVRRRSNAAAPLIAMALGACTHPDVGGLANIGAGSGNVAGNASVGNGGSGGVVAGGSTGEGPPVIGGVDTPPPTVVEVCRNAPYSDDYTPGQNNPPAPSDTEVQAVLNLMDQEGRIKQMQGVPTPTSTGQDRFDDIQRSENVTLLDTTEVRGYFYRDAARGLNLDARQEERQFIPGQNFSTTFPVASARGASFDLQLEYDIGAAIGDETVASQNSVLLAPCMNILRHPYWGRSQETYGEDVFHLGRMSSALTAGLQTHVAACAKHFAANNVELDRDRQDARLDEQTLREIYGRHFEMVVEDGGVACVMAAYNNINGVKSTQSRHLLTEILRDDFGFEGFVISDWWAMPGDQGTPGSGLNAGAALSQTVEAVRAGLDLEVPWTLNYNQIDEAIDQEQLTANDIAVSASRIIRQKMRFNALRADQPIGLKPTVTSLNQGSIVNNDAHIDLSRQAAVKSMVLLKNAAGTLPIQAGIGTIAVIGPQRTYGLQSTTGQPGINCTGTNNINCVANFATEIQIGDRGSSRVNPDPAKTIGPFAGLTTEGAERGVTVVSGNTAAAAQAADFVVVMVGLTPGDEGEEYAIASGGDRASLTLPDNQDQLIRDVVALGKPMVVVIQAGGIVNMPWLADVPAVVMAWYPGQQGGLALAQLLFGEANFSAKLPVSWAADAAWPAFKDSAEVTTMDYFLGYRYFDQNDITPVFPFGHGLSYSSFTYGETVQLGCPSAEKDSVIPVTVNVTNNSDVTGEEVVFVFAAYPNTTARRSQKELKGFQKVALDPGETKPVTIFIRARDLKYWQGDANGSWVVESGLVDLLVGKSSADADLTLRAQVMVQ